MKKDCGQIRMNFWLIMLIAAFALQWSVSGQAPKTQVSTPKVVLVSVDGAADWIVDDLLKRGVLPADGAFARLARRGVHAETMIPINVASTAPSHAALFTGAYPERTGIVTTSFLKQGEDLDIPFGPGFTSPLKAETLWTAAMRQGKRVICSTAVDADTNGPARTCTETRAFRRTEAGSSVAQLSAAGSSGILDPKTTGGYIERLRPLAVKPDSPGQLAYKLNSGVVVNLYAYAADRTADGKENYGSVILDLDQDPANGFAAELFPDKWAPLRLPSGANSLTGAWVYVTQMSTDLSKVEIYLGSAGSNPGSPAEFVNDINERFGFPPGEGDSGALNRGLITEKMYLEQFDRATAYEKEVVLDHLKRKDWDLLIGYISITDHIQHRFLVRDPRQLDYDLESGKRRERYARYVEQAYKQADAVIKAWMDAAPTDTNFVVVSDHGFVPAHHTILINNFLVKAGFKVAPTAEAEVRAYADAGSANIYVNLKGRQKNGTVAPERLDEYVDRLVKAVGDLRDPATNEFILEVALKREELKSLRLFDSERSPDVFISAKPGWSFSGRINPKVSIFLPSTMTPEGRSNLSADDQALLASGGLNETSPGVHGYLARFRQIESIFFSAGPNVPHRKLGKVNAVDVAPTVASILGIKPPKDAQGKALWP